ncbi:hypothetical protein FOZ60_004805 [Perkinsus olseni]|uniref:Uncharacterized protein n=1 Tax=Perkinsus olseni TaxID=32597 RepID=A0A7J6NSF6_PEROL|nr:hypothetical protein FOZ60_004805 [Perkinsus olseni]
MPLPNDSFCNYLQLYFINSSFNPTCAWQLDNMLPVKIITTQLVVLRTVSSCRTLPSPVPRQSSLSVIYLMLRPFLAALCLLSSTALVSSTPSVIEAISSTPDRYWEAPTSDQRATRLFQRHLRIKDAGVDIVVQEWDDAQSYPENVVVRMPSSYAVEHRADQIRAAQEACGLPVTSAPTTVEDRAQVHLCRMKVTSPPRAGYSREEDKYVIYVEGEVYEKEDIGAELDTTYEKTDLGKRLFVSHFTTLFNLYHEYSARSDVEIPAASKRWLMEAGKPWWKSENEKINLQGMGLSIELEEAVPGLGRKKQSFEVDWYTAHEETIGVRSAVKGGGKVHQISKLHVLANACYDDGSRRGSRSRSLGVFEDRDIKFTIVHRAGGGRSKSCREAMEILSPFALLHEDMMAAGEDSPWEDNQVGSLSKAFRRSSDIGDEGSTDGGDYSAASYSGSASESPFTDGGETVDAENDVIDDEEAEERQDEDDDDDDEDDDSTEGENNKGRSTAVLDAEEPCIPSDEIACPPDGDGDGIETEEGESSGGVTTGLFIDEDDDDEEEAPKVELRPVDKQKVTVIIPKDAFIPTDLRYYGLVPLINDNVGCRLRPTGDLKCSKLWKKSKRQPSSVTVKGGNWLTIGNVASGSLMVNFPHLAKTYAIEAQVKFKKQHRGADLSREVLSILGVTETESFPDLNERYQGKRYNGLDPHATRGSYLEGDGIIETYLFPRLSGTRSLLSNPEVKIIWGTWQYKTSQAFGKVQVNYGDAQPVVQVNLQFPNDEVPDDALAFLGIRKKTLLERAARKTGKVFGSIKVISSPVVLCTSSSLQAAPPRVYGLDPTRKFIGKQTRVLVTIAKSTSIPRRQLEAMSKELGLASPRKGLEMEGWLREDGTILSNVFAPTRKNKLYYAKIIKGSWMTKSRRFAWGKVKVQYSKKIAPVMNVQLKFAEDIPNSAFRALELHKKQSLWAKMKSRSGAMEVPRAAANRRYR